MYDAFISYSSYSHQDVAWAAKLETALRARGLEPYRDQTRLRVGEEWDNQIISAIIEGCRHIIVLWSDFAEKSQWVLTETVYFETAGRGDIQNPRRRIHINLQGQWSPFSKYEAVNDLAALYAQGTADLDRNPIWLRVLDRIEESIRQDNAIPIYKAILTQLTRDKPREIDFIADRLCG